jgi:hypothetical protein
VTRDQIIETIYRAIDPEIWAIDGPVPTRFDVNEFHARRQQSSRLATAALSALESAGLAVVPGHAMASGHMEESAGKALYEHHALHPNEQKPAWVPAGNAIRQDDARRLAMAAVNAWLAAAQEKTK